ncbi:MAG: hypothetical protein D6675_02350, partial [Gemmatimonadetes bacterium]
MSKWLFFWIIILIPALSWAIEVGGHITEDTVWSPENNPYHVVEDLYVDEGVTLRIEPGTIVEMKSAELLYPTQIGSWYWDNSGTARAKMIWVDGRILAEGTEQDSIVFTRDVNRQFYRWGCIFVSENSEELSVFKHCKVLFPLFISPTGFESYDGISAASGSLMIENCLFQNVQTAIDIHGSLDNCLIKGNTFQITERNDIRDYISYIYFNNGFNSDLTYIVGNTFERTDSSSAVGISIGSLGSKPIALVDNRFQGQVTLRLQGSDEPTYIYNNQFLDARHSIMFISRFEADTIYIHQNHLEIDPDFYGYGIEADFSYVDIADNDFYRCGIDMYASSGNVYNNYVYDDVIRSWTSSVYNNIVCYSSYYGYSMRLETPMFSNNISYFNRFVFSSLPSTVKNCILIGSESVNEFNNFYNTHRFQNCVIDFALQDSLIDGGGNIWEDPLFVDAENGDFHLLPNSPAIDAGFDTTAGYYPFFDMDYHERIFNDIIDIGVFEYGAPSLGTLRGYTLTTQNGEPVDYVLLKINNQDGWFEFSDSSGYYEFKLPTGTYDLHAERVFYDNAVTSGIEVEAGQITEVDIDLFSLVNV